MELKDIFTIANSTIWQDFKGFVRTTGYYSEEGNQLLVTIILILICFPFVGAMSPDFIIGTLIFFCVFLLVYGKSIYIVIQEYRIRYNVYDIEMASYKACMVRTKEHKYGIIEFKRDKKNRICQLEILLPFKYNIIKRVSPTVFIISNDKGKGLYNSKDKKIVVMPEYKDFKIINEEFYELEKIHNYYMVYDKE